MNEERNTVEFSSEDKCQNEYCGNEGTLYLHTCPYQEDIHGDSESLCNCCSECEHNCMMDI